MYLLWLPDSTHAKVILAWLRWPELNTNMFLCAGWRAETKREEGGQTGRLLIISHNPVKLSFRDKLNLQRLARCETLLIALMISRRHPPCTDSSPTAKQNLFRNSLAVISFLCMSLTWCVSSNLGDPEVRALYSPTALICSSGSRARAKCLQEKWKSRRAQA